MPVHSRTRWPLTLWMLPPFICSLNNGHDKTPVRSRHMRSVRRATVEDVRADQDRPVRQAEVTKDDRVDRIDRGQGGPIVVLLRVELEVVELEHRSSLPGLGVRRGRTPGAHD